MGVRYKPYKHKVNSWSFDPKNEESSRTDAKGRIVMNIGIGLKVTENETMEQIEEEIREDIYRDILQNIFVDKEKYVVITVLGKTPGLIITYENNLVMHNDYIPLMVNRIRASISQLDRRLMVKAMVNYVLNQKGLEKHSEEYKELTDTVNQICHTNFPSQLIMMVIKDELCHMERNYEGKEAEISDMSYMQLLYHIGNVAFLPECYSEETKQLFIKELMYRALKGDLISL